MYFVTLFDGPNVTPLCADETIDASEFEYVLDFKGK